MIKVCKVEKWEYKEGSGSLDDGELYYPKYREGYCVCCKRKLVQFLPKGKELELETHYETHMPVCKKEIEMEKKSENGYVVVDDKGIPLWDFAGDTEGRAIIKFMRMLPSLKY